VPETPEYLRGAIAALEKVIDEQDLDMDGDRVVINSVHISDPLESYRAQLRAAQPQHDWTPAFQAPYKVCRVCGMTESAGKDQPCGGRIPLRMGYLALAPDPDVLKDPEFVDASDRELSAYAFTKYGNDAKLYNGIHDLETRLMALIDKARKEAGRG